MALNPSIPLGVQPMQIASQGEQRMKALTLRDLQRRADEPQKIEEAKQKLMAVVQKHGGLMRDGKANEAALLEIEQTIDPALGAKLRGEIDKTVLPREQFAAENAQRNVLNSRQATLDAQAGQNQMEARGLAERQFLETQRRNQAAQATAAQTAQSALADRTADNTRQDAAAAETARHNKATEGIQRTVAGRPTAATNAAAATEAATKIDPKYNVALSRAIANLPAARNAQWKQLASNVASDPKQLGEVIMQAAVEGENVDEKNVIRGRRAAVAALQDINGALKELKTAGVSTNVLRGTVEDIAGKLGTTTDPRLVNLRSRILENLLLYRRSITGAAFGGTEAAEYAQLSPSYKNTSTLNEQMVSSLLDAMGTRDKAYWTGKLGRDGALLVGAIQDERQAPARTGGAGSSGGAGPSYQDYLNSRKAR